MLTLDILIYGALQYFYLYVCTQMLSHTKRVQVLKWDATLFYLNLSSSVSERHGFALTVVRKQLLCCHALEQCFPNFCFSTLMLLSGFFSSWSGSKIHLASTIVPDLVWLRGHTKSPQFGSTALESRVTFRKSFVI